MSKSSDKGGKKRQSGCQDRGRGRRWGGGQGECHSATTRYMLLVFPRKKRPRRSADYSDMWRIHNTDRTHVFSVIFSEKLKYLDHIYFWILLFTLIFLEHLKYCDTRTIWLFLKTMVTGIFLEQLKYLSLGIIWLCFGEHVMLEKPNESVLGSQYYQNILNQEE